MPHREAQIDFGNRPMGPDRFAGQVEETEDRASDRDNSTRSTQLCWA